MTNAVPIRIADAVTAKINAAVLAESLDVLGATVRRSYADWDEDFKGLDVPVIDVVFVSHQNSSSSTVSLGCAGMLEHNPSVDIAIRKRFDADDRGKDGRLKNESVDPFVSLLEKIHKLFVADRTGTVLPDEPNAKWQEADVKSWVNQRKLRKSLFEGVVRVNFQLYEAA